jgi:nucleoid-associated protein YgaU
MDKPQLVKATITELNGTLRLTANVISVMFNPTEYSFESSNSYKATPIPGIGSPLLQFVNGESDHLSMDLFLDDYTDPTSPPVAQRLKDITKLLEINRDLHAPPPVRFSWGPMEFTAVIEKLTRKVTMFHPGGAPARATLSVSFKEYRTLRQQLQEPRRQSADKSKRRVVVGNEQLWRIAAREYDDATEWVRIAQANDLDDPRDIEPGDWLRLPPVENPS